MMPSWQPGCFELSTDTLRKLLQLFADKAQHWLQRELSQPILFQTACARLFAITSLKWTLDGHPGQRGTFSCSTLKGLIGSNTVLHLHEGAVVIGVTMVLHLHKRLSHDWSKHSPSFEGRTAMIVVNTLSTPPIWLYKQIFWLILSTNCETALWTTPWYCNSRPNKRFLSTGLFLPTFDLYQ
jgi:hypothetical protein